MARLLRIGAGPTTALLASACAVTPADIQRARTLCHAENDWCHKQTLAAAAPAVAAPDRKGLDTACDWASAPRTVTAETDFATNEYRYPVASVREVDGGILLCGVIPEGGGGFRLTMSGGEGERLTLTGVAERSLRLDLRSVQPSRTVADRPALVATTTSTGVAEATLGDFTTLDMVVDGFAAHEGPAQLFAVQLLSNQSLSAGRITTQWVSGAYDHYGNGY